MPLFKVNPETCNRDGICATVCPLGIIDWQKGTLPVPGADAETLCIRCGHCVAVCPTSSLDHRDMPISSCPPVRSELQLGAEQCEHFLRARRSIRVYRNQPVEQEKLVQLIHMACYAPSGINSQGARWLVIANREELNRLAGIVIDWMRWLQTEMPEVAHSLHVGRAIGRWLAGQDIILRGAPALIVAYAEKDNRMAHSTCTLALSYLELAATSLGLGGCWAGYFNAAATTFPSMMVALGLPQGFQGYGAMMVGYPKFAYHRLPTRKTPLIDWRM